MTRSHARFFLGHHRRDACAGILIAAHVWLAAPTTRAAPPGEVIGVRFVDGAVLSWDSVVGSADYNVYRGLLSRLASGVPGQCHGDEITGTSFTTPTPPPFGDGFLYLVTGESSAGEEGTVGTSSAGAPRAVRGSCDTVVRNHVLDRTGYGWDEWSRDRIAALGTRSYTDEQVDPSSIDESTNAELNNRVAALGTLDNIQELQALDLLRAVYARRQLEQQAAMFWSNHFSTNYHKINEFFDLYDACKPYTDCVSYPDCCDLTKHRYATRLPYLDGEAFRDLAFSGSFREILEASALGQAMIIYLDTNVSVKGNPNENFARELLELHTMGALSGYAQQDVVELARVFTGWNVCKKSAEDASDPLAACIAGSLIGQPPPAPPEPPGAWVANFRPILHDNGQKILFQGTPYETIIPATPADSPSGILDAYLALDAIVAHPSTAHFIAKKLLQRFVTETPAQAMIDAVVAEWNDPTNPGSGVCSGSPLRCQGDLREVIRAVLTQSAFRSPDEIHGKIKTPFEHVASTLRATRGKTDGLTFVGSVLERMQEPQHENTEPTGYAEMGADWIDTNNILERQNWGLEMTSRTAGASPGLYNDIVGLLQANAIPTSPGTPGNAPAIVDFFSEVLFGGALTPSERQAAIDYLNTNSSGIPSSFSEARIRETVGFLMGYAQFLEQ